MSKADRSFPLRSVPICPRYDCRRVAERGVVSRASRNGNVDRPYYYCNFGHASVFVTWDDERGIDARNPLCRCGKRSRRDQSYDSHPREWYACSSGECSFKERIRTVGCDTNYPHDQRAGDDLDADGDFIMYQS
ncbi:hypothetical protein CEP54_010235 [Fusarium duplospermum]|uniref:GRF-like zinc ribbon domain-containing protein n=1 Tax=Fusarium duplospermum TaxID=1325734 RepID=A0A428PL12_9HYPO|nr:hypothetical protein CEP54_010235 [Fusarium duplospermum]